MITQNCIERVLATSNIVDVVGGFVQLKKAGVNYQACCPFHNEDTPSFKVNPAKQIFKCFGCGEGGNVIGFLMKKAGLTFPEAVSDLANRYGIPLEFDARDDDDTREMMARKREPLLRVIDMAAGFFARELAKSEAGRGYLTNRVTADDMDTWHLGFAPDGWDNLLNFFRKNNVADDSLLASGLIRKSEKTGHLYDYFRNRIIFPIHDISGRIIGFGGRVISSGTKDAKYLNSPESELYDKQRVLYGLHLAHKAMRTQNRCHLVEGYTDVIAMHRAGITNCVASCGTSITEPQLSIISRFTKNINLVSDGDIAGRKSMARTGAMAIKLGISVTNTILPDGADPDTIIKHYLYE